MSMPKAAWRMISCPRLQGRFGGVLALPVKVVVVDTVVHVFECAGSTLLVECDQQDMADIPVAGVERFRST